MLIKIVCDIIKTKIYENKVVLIVKLFKYFEIALFRAKSNPSKPIKKKRSSLFKWRDLGH
jgi:hypothetical protein